MNTKTTVQQNTMLATLGREGGAPYWALLAAALLLLGGGATYRLVAERVGAELAAPLRLDPPLSTLPPDIGLWQGEEVPVREGVLRIAGNDDYVSRNYRNVRTGEIVHLYIGYTARPRTMLRHRPGVCYPSAGWTPVSVQDDVLILAAPSSGNPSAASRLPVRLHSFLKPGVTEQRVVVLNYYVLNGNPTTDEDSFWGLSWRDPNRRRNPLRYVAQVQLAASVRTTPEAAARTLRQFAADSAPLILSLLPVSPDAADARVNR